MFEVYEFQGKRGGGTREKEKRQKIVQIGRCFVDKGDDITNGRIGMKILWLWALDTALMNDITHRLCGCMLN